MTEELVSVDVDAERRLIAFRLYGMAPSRQYVDIMLATYDRIPEVWSYNRLMDHRKFRGFIEFEDLQRIQAYWAKVMAGRSEMPRVAMVTRDALAHARTSASGNMFTSAHFRSFTSMRQAMAWIYETETAPV